jgi:hypothetical protein
MRGVLALFTVVGIFFVPTFLIYLLCAPWVAEHKENERLRRELQGAAEQIRCLTHN